MPAFLRLLSGTVLALGISLATGALALAQDLPAEFVKTNGYNLCDRAGTGRPLVLRGPNLGGWLMFESWMCPTGSLLPGDAVTVQRQIDAHLISRFGVETKNRLVEAYQSAWITARDLDLIRSVGMNLVRVPFSYLSFYETQPASVPLDNLVWKPEAVAFKHLDWIVAESAKRGIYVLLDLHEVEGPTAQGTPEGPESFWKQPAYQERMLELWRRVAKRYRGNPAVIGYDLLNEPWSTPIDLYERCYTAIRAVDPDHTLFVETWQYGRMPSPFGADAWTNVVCSLHLYNKDNADLQKTLDEALVPLASNKGMAEGGRNIPIHIGEFHIGSDEERKDEAWKVAIQAFSDNDIPWNNWTWKTVNQQSWCFINAQDATPRPRVPDLRNDSAEAIEQAWSGWVTRPGHDLYGVTRNRLAGPIVEDDRLKADAQGKAGFDVDTLVANDHSMSTKAELSILDPEPRTAHGTITAKDGSYTYQADPGFSGTDTFTYQLIDAANHQLALRLGKVEIVVPSRK